MGPPYSFTAKHAFISELGDIHNPISIKLEDPQFGSLLEKRDANSEPNINGAQGSVEPPWTAALQPETKFAMDLKRENYTQHGSIGNRLHSESKLPSAKGGPWSSNPQAQALAKFDDLTQQRPAIIKTDAGGSIENLPSQGPASVEGHLRQLSAFEEKTVIKLDHTNHVSGEAAESKKQEPQPTKQVINLNQV